MSAALAMASSIEAEFSNDHLACFVADHETHEAVYQAISARWPTATIQEGGLPVALSMMSQEPSPPLLLVDLTGSEDPASALQSLLSVCEPSTRIVVLGTVNDVALYRTMIANGASDYLVKPFLPEALADAIAGARRSVEAPQADDNGLRVMAVIGARDGVGASTLAVNAAWMMAHEMNKTVALVDLDLQFGTVSLALDLEPSHGLREAFEKPERIDGLFIASAMAHESERLFVLSGEEPLDDEIHINPQAFELLLNALPEDFDCVVVDLPARIAAAHREILSQVHAVAVISDLSLAGMRDTARVAQLARESAPDAALTVIVNKVGTGKSGELRKSEFQRGTELPVKHFLPNEPKLIAQAANSGKPLVVIGKRSPVVKGIRTVAQILLGERAQHSETSALAKLFQNNKKKPKKKKKSKS